MTTTITAVFDSKPEAERAQRSLAGQPVVGKDIVVTGKVISRKQAVERSDAMHDAVRRTEVDETSPAVLART